MVARKNAAEANILISSLQWYQKDTKSQDYFLLTFKTITLFDYHSVAAFDKR